jgi:hypothetical protein
MIDAVWAENSQRKNISAIEEAELLQRKLEQLQANGGGSQREVAEAWGLARPTVANKIRLLQLPPEIQQANREGKLSERACADLLRVAEVQQAANGAEWSSLRRSWNAPSSTPDELITAVLTAPETTTSAKVREWLTAVEAGVGGEVPLLIAEYDFADTTKDIKQPLCQGCPSRIKSKCFATACLESKKQAWVQASLHDLAEMNGWGLAEKSDVPKGWSDSNAIKQAWDAGIPADWLIGWSATEQLPRPWSQSAWLSQSGAFEGDGMKGFFVTVKGGRLNDDQVAALNKMNTAEDGESVVDIAGPLLQEAWKKAADKYGRDAERATKEALVRACLSSGRTAGDVFQALLNDEEETWIEHDNIDLLHKKLVNHLWKTGKGWKQWPSDAAAVMDRAVAMLARAGLDPYPVLSTGTEAGNYERSAICALSYFYEWHLNRWSDYRRQAAARINELLADWPTEEDETLTPLGEELRRAAAYATTWVDESELDEEE